MYKAIIWSGSLALAVLAYHFEAIASRWQFDRLCAGEGGSRFVVPYRKSGGSNPSWEVVTADPGAYRILLYLDDVSWVRFRHASGELMDAQFQSRHQPFELRPADESKPVQLRLSVRQELLADNTHIRRVQHLVTNVPQGQLLAQHTSLTYTWGAGDRLLLSPAISANCHGSSEDLKAFLKTVTQGVQLALRP